MSTAGDIINQALKDVGVIGPGEAASGDDVVDALDTLNQIFADWLILPTLVPKAPFVLSQVAELTDPLNLPAHYDSALRYTLGERLLTTFGLATRGDIIRMAALARKALKRSNLVIPELEIPEPLLHSRLYGAFCGDDPCA